MLQEQRIGIDGVYTFDKVQGQSIGSVRSRRWRLNIRRKDITSAIRAARTPA